MKNVTPIKPIEEAEDHSATDGLVTAVLEIAQRDAETRRQLKAALLRDDDEEALRLARQLVGVPQIIQFPKRDDVMKKHTQGRRTA